MCWCLPPGAAVRAGVEGAGQEPVLSKELLLSFMLLLSGPLSAAEGASGTGSGLFGESKLAGGEGKLLSTLSLPHLCVCPYACGRPHSTQLYQHVPETRWPIVYSPRYNITFMGLEKLHPFDAGKWGKVIDQGLSLKASLIKLWRALLTDYWKALLFSHQSPVGPLWPGRPIPVCRVPCRRERAFLRSLQAPFEQQGHQGRERLCVQFFQGPVSSAVP